MCKHGPTDHRNEIRNVNEVNGGKEALCEVEGDQHSPRRVKGTGYVEGVPAQAHHDEEDRNPGVAVVSSRSFDARKEGRMRREGYTFA